MYPIRPRVASTLFQMSSPSDEDQVLVASRPLAPDAESTALTDVYDAPWPLSSATLTGSSNSECNDFNANRGVPTLGMQLKARFVRLYPVTALVAEAVIGSDVVSLKDRITAVEGTDLDNMKVDNNKKARDDIGVRAEAARKIALFQSELVGVQTELSTVGMIALPGNALVASQAAKEARTARVPVSVARRTGAQRWRKVAHFPYVVHARWLT